MSMITPFNPNYTLSNGLKVVTVAPDPTNQLEPGYIMTLRLTDADGLFAVLKQTPNESNKVIFDVSEILRITKPSYDRHSGVSIVANGSVRRVILEAVEVWEGGSNSLSTETGFVIHGALQFEDGLLYDEANNRDVFLTEFKEMQATNGDFGTVAIAPTALSPTFPDDVSFEVFNEQGAQIQNFTVDLGLVTSDENTRVQFAALFPSSLAASASISLNTNWAYYTATFESDTITVHRACELPYEKYRLAFWNTRGGWDYFNFNLNHTELIEVERNEFTQLYGNWNGDTFGYSKYERGRAVYESTTQELVTVSAKVTQDESESLKKLLGSREVQLLQGDQGIPVIIEDTTFPVFHNLDRSKKTLTITFRKSHNILNA